jgi:predicted dehydrogenase/threonine dehydrogenase-like Zn-dependent dehydrogenase
MKQLLQNLRSGETSVIDVPIPQPRPGFALIRTAASLVSAGTERTLVEFAGKSLVGKARSRPDLVRQVLDKARREGLLTTIEATFNRLEQPTPLGYSSAGTVVALGERLKGFKVGDRVACAGGGYAVHAEYEIVPQNLMAHLPPEVDFESGAFATLGAIALHGFRLGETQVGERVAVIGLGLLGLLSVEIARAAGCSVFGVDFDPRRVALACELGAQAVLHQAAEESARSFSRGKSFDLVLICADTPSSDPVTLAGAIARDRARVVAIGAVGLQIPRKVYYEKELDFRVSRSYGPGRYDPAYEEDGQDYPIGFARWTEGRNLDAIVQLIAGRQMNVQALITHRFPIDEASRAYELITGKTGAPYLGVLVTYPNAGVAQEIEPGRRVDLTPSLPAPALDHVPGVSVLGAGNYASAVFLPAIQRAGSARLVGIASASGLTARQAAARFGFAYASTSEEQILADSQSDVLVILTRHNQHAAQVLAALHAGKHVYCEKPLAIQAKDLDQIADCLSQDAHSQLMIGFNRRFAPLARRMKDFIAESGEPFAAHYRINAGYLPLTHWTQDPHIGGGRIIGEACHFIDLISWLADAVPLSVTAQALPDLGRYREDNVILNFRFPNGSIGTVTYLANGDKSFPKERLEVFSAGRVAVLDDFRSLELVSNGQRKTTVSRLRQDKGHQHAWTAFLDAIRAGKPSPIPAYQLIGVTQAAFCAVEALQTSEKVDIRPPAVSIR